MSDWVSAAVGIAGIASLLVSVGIHWGRRQGKDSAQDEAQHRAEASQNQLAEQMSSLTGRVVPTLNRLDERATETLRQVIKIQERLDQHEGQIRDLDRRTFAQAEILRWLKSSAEFKAPKIPPPETKEDE